MEGYPLGVKYLGDGGYEIGLYNGKSYGSGYGKPESFPLG